MQAKTWAIGAGVMGAIAIVIGIAMWALVPRTVPPPHVIVYEDLPVQHEVVQIRGTAHYQAMIRQDIPGSLFREAETYYVYAMFPPHDFESRQIRLLVRSKEQPEPGVSFEYLELTGYLSKPDRYKVPLRTEDVLARRSDYFFTDDMMVIEPFVQKSYDPADEAR